MTTFVAGPRLGGMAAPMVRDGPINGDWAGAYVVTVLAAAPTRRHRHSRHPAEPQARRRPRRDPGPRRRLQFLPPCSPDLNAVELVCAKRKAPLQKAAERTIQSLWDRIGRLTDALSPRKCASDVTACGDEPDRSSRALTGQP
ncbi:MAG: hypothetical protein AAF677_09165 [Pseudomonadota bacterium]